MRITKAQFEALYNIYINKNTKTINQEDILFFIQNKIIEGEKITKEGYDILNQYKVKNAIILAAGLSSRFVPLSYEKPKGLAMVKGEVLIERLIKQLKEAGVEEIVVILGHMVDKFIYLKDKYHVKIVINNDYKERNTHSSLFVARDYLNGSYICCADNYYPTNPFHSHEYHSYTSSLYVDGIEEGERGIFTNEEGLIVDTRRPAENQYIMLGFQYFDKEFCKNFVPILEEAYHREDTRKMYWEQIYAQHVEQLKLYEKRFKWEDILEFDTVEELEKYDSNYLCYHNYQFIENICHILKCFPSEIKELAPISKGLTNKTFSFKVKNQKYVYRYPGSDAPEKIDRIIEKENQEFAKKIGIDDSYIYEDAEEGWKISYFVETDTSFDFKNSKHIKLLCDTLRRLNKAHRKCGKEFNYIKKIENILEQIKEIDLKVYNIIVAYYQNVLKINELIKRDNWNCELSHNDIWEDNLLLKDNKLYLIDWEYAGDTDIGYDISKLCVKSECAFSDLPEYLQHYFERIPTKEEVNHLIGCTAVSYYYWFIWATYMRLVGYDYGYWVDRYKRVFISYYNEYLEIYKEEF